MERTPRAAVREAGRLASPSAERTFQIGRGLGAVAEPGTTIALSGPLGAGKTLLTKGIAAGLGVPGVVNSPTFILMNEHLGRLRLFHVDAYRLEDPEEALAAGLFDERQAEGVTVIEWAERVAEYVPTDRLEIEIVPDLAAGEEYRTLHWYAYGATHAELAARALEREAAA